MLFISRNAAGIILLASVMILQTSGLTEKACMWKDDGKQDKRMIERVFFISAPLSLTFFLSRWSRLSRANLRPKKDRKVSRKKRRKRNTSPVKHNKKQSLENDLCTVLDRKSGCAKTGTSTELQEVIYLIEYAAMLEVYRQGFQALEKYR